MSSTDTRTAACRLPHQIRLLALGSCHPHVTGAHELSGTPLTSHIALSCSCLTTPRPGRIIEMRTLFPAADAIAAWQSWHEQQGVML